MQDCLGHTLAGSFSYLFIGLHGIRECYCGGVNL